MATEAKWRCNECFGLHDRENDAQECCMPSVSAVFICPVCIEAHESESEAESCCDMNSDPPNNDLIIPMFIAVGVSTEKYIEKFNEVNHLKG